MAKRDPREVALLSLRLRRLLDTWECRIEDAADRLGMAKSSFTNALYALNAPRGLGYKALSKKLKAEEKKAQLPPLKLEPTETKPETPKCS